MAKETKYSVKDLKQDFPSEEACLNFIFEAQHSRACSCGGEYKLITGRRQFQCSKCRYQIAPCGNSIFHKSDTLLTLWFHAIWIFSNAKSGISAKEMERQLGVTYKCAWRILSLIRKALENDRHALLGGIVESDVAYFGGRRYSGEYNKWQRQALAAKTIAIAAVQRDGEMRVRVIPANTTAETEKFIDATVEDGSALFTDGGTTYLSSKKNYGHFAVDHSKKIFAKGIVHVNRVEAFWHHVKGSIKGTFKSVSKQHLQSYLDSFAWHYNNRHNDRKRFVALLGIVVQPLG